MKSMFAWRQDKRRVRRPPMFLITINPKATIGANCNIHKGVTIGQENRGQRKGVPTIIMSGLGSMLQLLEKSI